MLIPRLAGKSSSTASSKTCSDGTKNKQAKEAIVKAQLGWFELNGFAARALSP